MQIRRSKKVFGFFIVEKYAVSSSVLLFCRMYREVSVECCFRLVLDTILISLCFIKITRTDTGFLYNFAFALLYQNHSNRHEFSIQFCFRFASSKSLEQKRVLDTILLSLCFIKITRTDKGYLNFFLARFGSLSNSLLINASFFAFDHFLILFSVSIALFTLVNAA